MVKAYRIGEKAANAGFDWDKREDVWEKVQEEVGEVNREIENHDQDKLEGEFGDLFFALINTCRLYGVDPEAALERTNRKFIQRFNYMEDRAVEQGHILSELPLEQMESYWQEAKGKE